MNLKRLSEWLLNNGANILLIAFIVDLFIAYLLRESRYVSFPIFILILLVPTAILYLLLLGFMFLFAKLQTGHKHKKIWAFGLIVVGYLILSGALLFCFSCFYRVSESQSWGYLKYGQCSDVYSEDMLTSDSNKSSHYIYFSAVTLYSLGYGDICPMGFDKEIAVANVIVGHFFTVVVLALSIGQFINSKEK
jgi:hypothetical protein